VQRMTRRIDARRHQDCHVDELHLTGRHGPRRTATSDAGAPIARVDARVLYRAVVQSERRVVVIDDDPTGTQSVADVPIVTQWEVGDLRWALAQAATTLFVLTNSRSRPVMALTSPGKCPDNRLAVSPALKPTPSKLGSRATTESGSKIAAPERPWGAAGFVRTWSLRRPRSIHRWAAPAMVGFDRVVSGRHHAHNTERKDSTLLVPYPQSHFQKAFVA